MNKILILIAIFFTFNFQSNAQGVAINTTSAAADASAALDVQSTTQGMLVPRMTASQRGMIATPATGLLVYQTDGTAGFYFYNGTAWTSLSGGGSGDNLGNHTATQALNMGNFDITNVKEIMPSRLRFNINQTAYTFTSSNVALWNNPTGICQVISTQIPASHTGNTVVKFTSTLAISLHGFPAGVDGQLLMIMTTGGTSLQINHQSTANGQVAGASQFWNPINSNPIAFGGPGFILCMYDTSLNNGISAWLYILHQA